MISTQPESSRSGLVVLVVGGATEICQAPTEVKKACTARLHVAERGLLLREEVEKGILHLPNVILLVDDDIFRAPVAWVDLAAKHLILVRRRRVMVVHGRILHRLQLPPRRQRLLSVAAK